VTHLKKKQADQQQYYNDRFHGGVKDQQFSKDHRNDQRYFYIQLRQEIKNEGIATDAGAWYGLIKTVK